MKISNVYLYSLVLMCNTYSGSHALEPTVYYGDRESATIEPTIYADINPDVIENAVSFDGLYALIGIGISYQKYGAAINNKFTNNNFNLSSSNIGMGYIKGLKNNINLGMEASVTLARKKKKKDNIDELDEIQYRQLESCFITPHADIKCGYLFKKYKTLVFGKIGISRIGGTYNYYKENNTRQHSINVNTFVPTVGIGGEVKFSRKLGVMFDINVPIRKTKSTIFGDTIHKTKVGITDIRLSVTYNLQNSQLQN